MDALYPIRSYSRLSLNKNFKYWKPFLNHIYLYSTEVPLELKNFGVMGYKWSLRMEPRGNESFPLWWVNS